MDQREADLKAPFSADRLEWRVQSCGKKEDGTIWCRVLAYIDNRAIMERLDSVFGPTWSQEEGYSMTGNKAVCIVKLHCDNRTVTGSCQVPLDKDDDIDPYKTAASGAMKRAAVLLGIGRYLYDMQETWGVISERGQYHGKTKDGTRFKWNPPSLDDAKPAEPMVDYTPSPASAPAPAKKATVSSSGDDQPMTLADAMEYQYPFGKHKGKTMGEVAKVDQRAVLWVAETYEVKEGKYAHKDRALKQAAKMVLAATKEESSDDVPF